MRVDEARDNVDESHQDGQDVHTETADTEQSVRSSEIGDGAQGDTLHEAQARQEIICRNEKRNLQEKRDRFHEYILESVVVLAVISLEDHYALVALEGCLDTVNIGLHEALLLPLFVLEIVRILVKRQDEEVDDKAYRNDGEGNIARVFIGTKENTLKNKFQGFYKEKK